MSQCSGIRHLTSRSATKQPHLKINAPPPPRPPPLLLLLLFLHPNATCSQRVLLAERRRRRSVAMFVQAHAFVLAEGDGPRRALCMVPRAQRPLSQVLKMPRSLVLQPGLSAVPLVSRTSRGVLGHPVRACLRPASEGIEGEGPGLCRGTAEGAEDAEPLVSAGCLSDHWCDLRSGC